MFPSESDKSASGPEADRIVVSSRPFLNQDRADELTMLQGLDFVFPPLDCGEKALDIAITRQ
jgi:hypothetical protein